MNRLRISAYLILIPLTFAVAVAQDELPKWPERVIEFEIIDEPMPTYDSTAAPGENPARFAVTITIEDDAGFGSPKGKTSGELRQIRTEKLLKTGAAAKFSDAQRAFVGSVTWLRHRGEHVTQRDEWRETRVRYALYAVSEVDARLMATATLEMLDADRRANFETNRAWLVGFKNDVANAEQQLPVLQQELQKLQQDVQRAQRAAPYKDRDAAEDDIVQLRRTLRALDVSLAEINAKTRTIRKIKSEEKGPVDESNLVLLDRLLIEQDIELAGVLAKKELLEVHLRVADDYVASEAAYEKTKEQANMLRKDLEMSRNSARNLSEQLRNPDFSLRPVRLFGKATIQRVQYVEGE